MKRVLLVVCLIITLILGGGAQAQAASIRDGAAILAVQTQSDATRLSKLVEDKTGIQLAVEIRHFLGGAEAGAYARRLLQELPDPDNSLLLLAVVGEESYALAAGKEANQLIGQDTRDTLLSISFRAPFLDRRYDEAVGAYMLSMAEALGKATGESLNLQGYFGYTAAPPAPAVNGGLSGINILDFILGEPVSESQQKAKESSNREDKGLGLGSIIVIGLVLSSVFGKKKGRKGRRNGCGPLGWIFGVFGLSKLFGWRR